MRKLLSTVFLLTVFGLAAFADAFDFGEIDQYAKSPVPQTIAQDLPSLVAHLSSPASNDYEKVRAFYVWIAENIAYDTQYYFDPSSKDACVSVDCILHQQVSVCAGFARLFEKMCTAAGITAYTIEGYSKGMGYFEGNKFTKGDHAWNVVKVNGKWHLVDVTWGAGTVTSNGGFKAQFNEDYFLANPEELVRTHLPLDPIFQLLDSPVPVKVFEKGDQAIIQHIKAKPSRLDFKSALIKHGHTPKIERDFRSALRAYKFNPDNIYDYAFSCLTYADALSAPLRVKNMKELSYVKVIEKANSSYKTAVECFSQIDGHIAKHNLVYCTGQIEQMTYLLDQFRAIASAN
ncbi:MAG: transglutaminase domain-containing protein [Bacteroidota bacterium]